jgi:hypothetical protein
MANKKKNPIESRNEELVSKIDKITDDITLPVIEDTQREMILDLRVKGFDDNRIAARLEIQKAIVEKIK